MSAGAQGLEGRLDLEEPASALARSPTAREMRGPSALGGEPRRFLSLTWTLAITDFRLKFFGSVLGYLWQVMRPLMLFGVIYLVFVVFISVGSNVKDQPVVILSGVMIFTFFSEATGAAVTSVMDRENLVRKIRFPRMVIPSSVVVTALMNFALNLLVLFVFMMITGVDVTWRWVEAPLLIAALAVLALGAAMLVSSLYVIARDVRPIWDVVLQVLFYATPILYPLESVGSVHARKLMMLNPLAIISQQWRHSMIDPSAPSAIQAAGGVVWLAVPVAITVGLLLVGFHVFNRMAPRIAEEL